jgi:hypothetical protein
MKSKKDIEKEIRRLKDERKNLYLDYINNHDIDPSIAIIGCAKYTTQILMLRWVLN